ncbi:MAG: ribose 5-phosphate isomerase B [Bacteroides sp.]|nr:ribose 5-phosphate isomerase B [Eubacterium sp.]MCM1418869.1 ribose 5-phosphate isomerase B [Roseburia sp.]MCM1463334.1 ribose 5-phosphate isomerase B [Bacteroides sp.]
MIYIGCDHGGYALKRELLKYLSEEGFLFTDLGCDGETVDYPDIAEAVCKKVLESEDNRGVLICGTGVGISIAANKIKGIRAALCGDWYSAKYTRLHNDANVICMGGRTTGSGLAAEILDVFLHTSFEGGKHAARVNKIKKLEG